MNEEKDESGNLLLHNAVRGGELWCNLCLRIGDILSHVGLPCLPLLFLLVNQSGADVNRTNDEGISPLCLACQCGEEKVAEVGVACDAHPPSLSLVCVLGSGLCVRCQIEHWQWHEWLDCPPLQCE